MARLGTFTVEELASRSGVSEATVRTVIRRNPTFTREVGMEPTGRPGGQRRRYLVDPEHEAELHEMLENIRADLVPADEGIDEPGRLPVALAGDPIWLPLSVSAAEAILLDELPTASDDRRPGLLQAADEYIEHAQLTLDSADGSEPTTAYLAAHMELLGFIRSVAFAEVHGAPQGQLQPSALMAQWGELPWAVLGADAAANILARLHELVEASAAREADEMPVEVVYSAQHRVPWRLGRALRRMKAAYNEVQVDLVNIGSVNPLTAGGIFAPVAEPRLYVCAFNHASVKDSDPAALIPAVAQKLGPMDKLVVASEDMDREVYGQAVKHGATFLVLDAGEAPDDALKREMNRVSERFVAETCHSAFSAALGTPHSPHGSTAFGLMSVNTLAVGVRRSTRTTSPGTPTTSPGTPTTPAPPVPVRSGAGRSRRG